MNRQASILFNFIDSSIGGNWLALQETSAPHTYYQRLIYTLLSRSLYTTEGFQALGRQLANLAHHAYFVRQIETVDQASQMMLALPISRELQGVAHYYQAICTKRKGDFDGAHRLLERALEEAPSQYRARALLTTGATYYARGEADVALPFWVAAGKAAMDCDLLTLVESQHGIALIRSIHGDHKQALNDLENLFPHCRAIANRYPLLYYSFLNSLAVELGEVGRIAEAKAACSIALASPFGAIYPEIAQTRDELEAKRTAATPSIVAVSTAPEPVPTPQAQPAREPKPVHTLACIWPARSNQFLQTSIPIAAATAAIGATQTTLDRVRHCIQPRSPPTCS